MMLRQKKTPLLNLLSLAILIIVSACSDPQPNAQTDRGSSQQATVQAKVDADMTGTAADESTSLPHAYDLIETRLGDLDTMVKHRVIRVLTVYGIGRYYVDNAAEKGLVSESTRHFENFINRRLKRRHVKVHVVVIPVARNQLIPTLLAGRGDMIIAGLSITPERQQDVEFSIPASKPLSEILVTGPSAPPLLTIDDLSGQTVFVRESSSYRESVQRLNQRFLSEDRAPVQIEAVSELLEDEDLVEMVNGGLLPWAIVDDYKPHWWTTVFTKISVRDDIVLHSGTEIAWAMRKNSPKLKKAVDDFLRKNREGTLIGNVLKNKYIRDFDWAGNALSDEEYHRFHKLGRIFRKYGEQYDFDYLMIAAQAYQESRLIQSARSHAGAIGVMQIKASTARDRNVNIKNIHTVDANIHAGVKYMDFLRNRYFSAPDIEPLNRTLLSLAAYNVGPARMIRLRNKASKQGYNPNVWFDNVELIAAREVGREPVQYVANIYKYYLAYMLSEEQLKQRNSARRSAGIL